MQRLFSTFPRGWPGIGLLLLRISVAGACLQAYSGWQIHRAWKLLALIPLSACLCAGVLTPILAGLGSALQLSVAATQVDGIGLPATAIAASAALALLGPGAYSLDALRFGRRVILAESWRDLDCE